MACNYLMGILAKRGMKIQNKPTNLYWKANHLQPSPVWTSFCLRAGFLGRESRPTSTIHHSTTYAYHSYRKWFCIFWRKIGHIGGKLMWSDFAWVAQWTVNECLHRVSEKCCVSYSASTCDISSSGVHCSLAYLPVDWFCMTLYDTCSVLIVNL